MKNGISTTIGLALTAFIGVGAIAFVPVAEGQTRADQTRALEYGGSLDARQHGYEHAYRDGADQGRQTATREDGRIPGGITTTGARAATNGTFGDRNEHMEGYRAGYQAG